MAIVTACPRCRAELRLPDSHQGKKLRCLNCDSTFTTVSDDDAFTRPRRRDDDRDERPAPRRRREVAAAGGSPMLKLGLACGFFVLLIAGVWGYAIVSSKPKEAKARDGDDVEEVAANKPSTSTSTASNSQNNLPPTWVPQNHPNQPQTPSISPFLNNNNDPQNLQSALTMLRDNNANRVKSALKWLGSAKVEEARRDEVSRALNEPLAKHRRDALPAVARWATKNNAEALLPCLDDSDANARGRAMEALATIDDETCLEAVAKQLTLAGREAAASKALKASPPRTAEKVVLKYLNPPRGNGAREADQLLKSYKTPISLMIDQTIDDLTSNDVGVRKSACNWLAKTPVDLERQSKVARALEGLLLDSDKSVRLPAVKALENWGMRESIVLLTDALKDPALRDAAMQALLKQKSEAVIPVLAANLGSRECEQISTALLGFGSKAERPVWLPLERGDLMTRRKAVDILAEIGTGESIKILTRFATLERANRNTGNQEAALDAIKKIRDRVGGGLVKP